MSDYSSDEQMLLAILKNMYLNERGQITKCQNQQYFVAHWPGTPATLDALGNSLESLVARRYLVYSSKMYCLTDNGLRAIGALPRQPASQ